MDRLIGARERFGRMQQGLTEDARATLAESGGLSLPGVEQGGTNAAIRRISERIAPDFASELRELEAEALDTSNASLMQSLQLATGMSADMARNVLSGAQTTTQRQQILAGIALDSLSQNMQWNQFLAQFGLDRVRLEEEIRMGRIATLVPLLQLFLQGAQTAAGGYI
jgi:hypothetical protein